MYVEDFAVSTNDYSIEFVTYEETPQKLAKVDFTWNKELFNPRCLLLVDRGALLNCSKHFWNEDPKKCETVVHFILLWMNYLRPKCGVSEKEWASTALIPSWRIWQVRQTYKAKSSQTTALTKPWWRSWKLQTNCSEQLSVCANERSLEDYEEGDENEQWDIFFIISAECAMAQFRRVCQLLAKITCCKHSCGDRSFSSSMMKGRQPLTISLAVNFLSSCRRCLNLQVILNNFHWSKRLKTQKLWFFLYMFWKSISLRIWFWIMCIKPIKYTWWNKWVTLQKNVHM